MLSETLGISLQLRGRYEDTSLAPASADQSDPEHGSSTARTPLTAAGSQFCIAHLHHADLLPMGSNGNSAAIKASTPYNAAQTQMGMELSRMY